MPNIPTVQSHVQELTAVCDTYIWYSLCSVLYWNLTYCLSPFWDFQTTSKCDSNNHLQSSLWEHTLSYHERTIALTLRARAWLHFSILGLNKWTQHIATFVTVILHDWQLRKNTCCCCHHTSCANKLVQMDLPVTRKNKQTLQYDVKSNQILHVYIQTEHTSFDTAIRNNGRIFT
jgi:hypothetical protein